MLACRDSVGAGWGWGGHGALVRGGKGQSGPPMLHEAWEWASGCLPVSPAGGPDWGEGLKLTVPLVPWEAVPRVQSLEEADRCSLLNVFTEMRVCVCVCVPFTLAIA